MLWWQEECQKAGDAANAQVLTTELVRRSRLRFHAHVRLREPLLVRWQHSDEPLDDAWLLGKATHKNIDGSVDVKLTMGQSLLEMAAIDIVMLPAELVGQVDPLDGVPTSFLAAHNLLPPEPPGETTVVELSGDEATLSLVKSYTAAKRQLIDRMLAGECIVGGVG